jgi:hypothetical protein
MCWRTIKTVVNDYETAAAFTLATSTMTEIVKTWNVIGTLFIYCDQSVKCFFRCLASSNFYTA